MLAQRLGAYEILARLGQGGMGEVYRARDTKLGREVAIKVLPSEFVSDGERVARFQREAQVLASLNHPHIAQIYGFEQAGETSELVMELVDGETSGASSASQRPGVGAPPLMRASSARYVAGHLIYEQGGALYADLSAKCKGSRDRVGGAGHFRGRDRGHASCGGRTAVHGAPDQ